MLLNEAIALGEKGCWQEAQVRISPGTKTPESSTQWFVMLRDASNKSFVLADNNDQPIATEDMSALAQLIRSIGLKEFTVFL
ncbi:MAG: hypothetical protein P1U47_14115 [Zhongshania sp.]|uniref:hypothetical protein n=1 Tax=Zhongshania sp. TaxID=1971902 RepID=UPI0026044AC8|nr:hypothetical protein [Zhongshania sp.]MDF1693511.1 hypothetical protein [Zhongshania sp.]